MSIYLDTAVDAARDLPVATDFKAAIADDARCLGIWRFGRESVTLGAGAAIASVANWKTGGGALTQSDANRRPALVYDDTLRRMVAQFDTSGIAQVLTAPAVLWSPDFAWTIVAVVRPTAGAGGTDFHMVAGDFKDARNFAGLVTVGNPLTYQAVESTAQAQGTGRQGWNRAIATNAADALYTPSLRLNESVAVRGPSAGSGNGPAGLTFSVGNAFLPYGGGVDLIGLFNVDLFSAAQADMLDLVTRFLDERNGFAV